MGLVIASVVFLVGAAAIVLLEIRHRRDRRDALRWRRIEERLPMIGRLEALGVLAGGIAHEFNNIFFVIMGYADMALDELASDSPARRDLEKILGAGERARDLTARILDLSRGTAGDPQPLPMTPLVKETVKLLEAGHPEGIDITCRVEDGQELSVIARPVDLYQIILNLCGNAIESVRPGGGVLSIELRRREMGGGGDAPPPPLVPGKYVLLRVSISGSSLALDGRRRLEAPASASSCAGLDLAAVRSIVRELRGEITDGASAGAGVAFEVFLPAAPISGGQSEITLLS